MPRLDRSFPAARRLGILMWVLLAAAYALQAKTVLKLEHDSVCYLIDAQVLADGPEALCPGCSRARCAVRHPRGYAVAAAGLIRAGVAASWSFVLFNLLCLGAGAVAVRRILIRSVGLSHSAADGTIWLWLLSFATIKHIAIPLSEFLYIAVSLCALLLLCEAERGTGRWRWPLVLLAATLGMAAMLVRTIGVVVLVASAVTAARLAVGERDVLLEFRRWRWRAPATIALVIGAAALAVILFRSDYVQRDLAGRYGSGIGTALMSDLDYRTQEWGELALNLPLGKVPAVVAGVAALPLRLAGAIFALAFAFALWRRVRGRVGAVEAYLIGYSGIMAIWPYYDTRFWIPVVPLIAGILVWAMRGYPVPWGRPLRAAYLIWFAVLGVAALGVSSRRSLAGAGLADTYGDSYLGPVYRVAFGRGSAADSATADRTALHILRSFEKTAR